MPREALTPRMKVLLWPFRMPGIAIITTIVTLLVVGAMFPISRAQAIRLPGSMVKPAQRC
jgi:hypothetical protein